MTNPELFSVAMDFTTMLSSLVVVGLAFQWRNQESKKTKSQVALEIVKTALRARRICNEIGAGVLPFVSSPNVKDAFSYNQEFSNYLSSIFSQNSDLLDDLILKQKLYKEGFDKNDNNFDTLISFFGSRMHDASQFQRSINQRMMLEKHLREACEEGKGIPENAGHTIEKSQNEMIGLFAEKLAKPLTDDSAGIVKASNVIVDKCVPYIYFEKD